MPAFDVSEELAGMEGTIEGATGFAVDEYEDGVTGDTSGAATGP
jgi:hypothetical protein